MKPYMLIEGSNQAVEAFEKKIADALDLGYGLAGELVTHTASPNEIKFFQSVLLSEEEEEDEDFDDEEEEDE